MVWSWHRSGYSSFFFLYRSFVWVSRFGCMDGALSVVWSTFRWKKGKPTNVYRHLCISTSVLPWEPSRTASKVLSLKMQKYCSAKKIMRWKKTVVHRKPNILIIIWFPLKIEPIEMHRGFVLIQLLGLGKTGLYKRAESSREIRRYWPKVASGGQEVHPGAGTPAPSAAPSQL